MLGLLPLPLRMTLSLCPPEGLGARSTLGGRPLPQGPQLMGKTECLVKGSHSAMGSGLCSGA